MRHRGSISSRLPPLQRAETQGTTLSQMRSNSIVSVSVGAADGLADDENAQHTAICHSVEPRARTAILPPVGTKVADKDPLCWLAFTADAVLTSCKNGE